MKKFIQIFRLLFVNITPSQVSYCYSWRGSYFYNNVKDFIKRVDGVYAIVDHTIFSSNINAGKVFFAITKGTVAFGHRIFFTVDNLVKLGVFFNISAKDKQFSTVDGSNKTPLLKGTDIINLGVDSSLVYKTNTDEESELFWRKEGEDKVNLTGNKIAPATYRKLRTFKGNLETTAVKIFN